MTLKVSVIVPTRNMVGTIGQSLESVLQQTHNDLEVIVVDDASTDQTVDILSSVRDTRLEVIRMPICGGPSAARNAGIRAAGGELIAFLDADDIWLPSKLTKQVSTFEQDEALGLVYCGAYHVDQDLRYLRTQPLGDTWPPPGEEAFRRVILRHSFIAAPLSSMVLRRECFYELGLFDEAIIQAEEWDLALRLVKEWGISYVPEPLVLYRMTGHFNAEKRLKRHIGDAHETTINRAFARLGDPPELEPLRQLALVDTWWRVALNKYAMQQPDQASIELERIARMSPDDLDFECNPRLRVSLAYMAWGLYDTVTPLDEAMAFVDYAFDNFPCTVQYRPSDRRMVKAQVAEITAFDSFPRGEPLRTWQATGMALLLDPSRLSNRGLLKLLFRSILPPRSHEDQLLDKLRFSGSVGFSARKR